MKDNIKILPLSSANWKDFVSLMKGDSQCSECWCLNHREQSGCPTGAEAQKKMNSMVTMAKIHGLLASQEGIPLISDLALDQ